MDLSDYIRILRQKGWLIILVAVLTAAAAFGFSKLQTPVYESSLRLLVQPARTDFGQAQAAKQLLRGYVQWIRSSYRAATVVNELELDMTPSQLLSDVEVASDDSSFVIQINVENSDPDVANDIARTWGNVFVQWRIDDNATQRKEDRVDVEFIDDPQAALSSPKTKINTAAGAVFGALLGTVLVFGLEWLESGVVRRSEDVERYLDIPVIGSIPGQK
ncbi:MAG: Wzz/FepE/Etk N-terminal domain-containing protein [Chloroflexota bacterium]